MERHLFLPLIVKNFPYLSIKLCNFIVYCCRLVTQSCPTLCDPMDCSMPGLPVLHHVLKLVQTHVHWVSDATQPSDPLSHHSSPAFSLSQHQDFFQRVNSAHASGSASVPLMNIQGWVLLGLTALNSLQRILVPLKSLFQHHDSKVLILCCSAFFMVQLSQPYMTTGKTIALIRWTFVGKVMSLLFNMLPKLVIAFLSRSKHLISWLQSSSAVILEPPK